VNGPMAGHEGTGVSETPTPPHPHTPTLRVVDYLLALASGVLASVLYLRTLAPGLLGGDSGEFQFAAWLGGLAHPTGYPLYLMLGWLWTHLLPWHDPAWRMNAFSALCGGVATGLVYLVALRVLRAASKPDLSTLVEGELPPGLGGEGGGRISAGEGEGAPPSSSGSSGAHVAIATISSADWKSPSESEKRPQPLTSQSLRGLLRLRQGFSIPERLPAFFAALTFAVTPTFWSQAVVAEVYALNAVFVAGILLGLVSWAECLDRRWLYATALLFGLSLAHHRTTLLYIPAIGVFLWLTWRARIGERGSGGAEEQGSRGSEERSPLHPRTLAPLLALVCLPLLLYAYIPLRAPHVPYLQVEVSSEQTLQLYRPTLEGFIEHVSGQGFGSAIGAGRVTPAELRSTVGLFVRELTMPGLLLGLLGLIWLATRSRSLLALTGLSFLALAGFNLVYGIGDIYVYYIPAYMIWVLWMAVGVAACGRVGVWVYGRGRERRGKGAGEQRSEGAGESALATRNPNRLVYLFAFLLGLLAFALPLYLLIAHFPQIDRSHDNSVRTAWEVILSQPIPQDAILVTNDRDEMVPQWYLKYVEGRRPDLTGLFPLIQPESEWADVGAVAESAVLSGRPVDLIKPMPGLEVKFALEPVQTQAQGTMGALERVLGPAAPQPPEQAAAAVYDDTIRLAGYDLNPAALVPGGTAEITLHWQPLKNLVADYTTFVHLVDADGVKLAQSDHQPGGAYYPTSLWKPDEVLADRHMLTLPSSLGHPPYAIVVGLYDSAADMRPLGEPQQVGMWTPEK
jgi:hypothetical protein